MIERVVKKSRVCGAEQTTTSMSHEATKGKVETHPSTWWQIIASCLPG